MKKRVANLFDNVNDITTEIEQGVEKQIAPVRTSILKRFPTVFLLAVTFGVSIVAYSIQVILEKTNFITNHPWLGLGIGMGILILTGTLYKKLS